MSIFEKLFKTEKKTVSKSPRNNSTSEPPLKRNNVRYRLDFAIIPKMIELDGQNFMLNLLTYKEAYMCDLFNRVYDKVNHIYFPDHPRTFEEHDFNVCTYVYSESNRITYVSLPSSFDGSPVICIGYAFAYEISGTQFNNIRCFTLEKGITGTDCLGIMRKDGTHCNFGSLESTLDANIEKIAKIAFR